MKNANCLMKKSAYIITKPLQYINATNIPDSLTKDCFLIDYFYNTENFYNIIKKYSSHWDNVKIFQSRYSAIFMIIKNKKEYKNLYVDSDYGILITFLFLMLSNIKIYTYEEGYGSYRFIRKNKSLKDKIKSTFYAIMGCKNWIGGNRYTKGIYLYHPNVFRNLIKQNKKELFAFSLPFNVHLNNLSELSFLSQQIKTELYSDKKVLIYLTSWTINPKITTILNKYPDYLKILKPHPHLKSKNVEEYNFDMVYDNSIPAEILISKISQVSKKMVLVHENSSSLIYLNSDQITTINISESTIENHQYNTIMKQLNCFNTKDLT